MESHNILVTGATGFIGAHLCRALTGEGHNVRAFHRPSSPLTLLEGLELEHCVGDVTQPATLVEAMQDVQVVFHVAAQLGAAPDPSQFYSVTVEGTRNVLQAAARAGAERVIHTSSVAALGTPPEIAGTASPYLMNENHTWNHDPNWWPYGHAKYLAELAVQEAVACGRDVVIVNPAVVIGAGDIHRVSGDVILHVARGNLPFAIKGGLNVVAIADVVDGHLAAWRKGRKGERYILGGENMTHLRFLQLVAEVVGVRPPVRALPTGLVRALAGPAGALSNVMTLPITSDALRRAGYHFYYDAQKSIHELGMEQARPIRQAVVEAYQWYQDQGFIERRFK